MTFLRTASAVLCVSPAGTSRWPFAVSSTPASPLAADNNIPEAANSVRSISQRNSQAPIVARPTARPELEKEIQDA